MSDPQETGSESPKEEGLKVSEIKIPEEAVKPSMPEAAPMRAVGSPLPMGSGGSASPLPPVTDAPRPYVPPPPPGRTLAAPPSISPMDVPGVVQKAVSGMRAALPWIQRILPLLDGNIGMAVSNMLAPHHPQQQQAHTPAQPVDLAPLVNNLTELHSGQVELKAQQRDLRAQLVEQNTSLKRVEDHLEMVREATDRNTLEQQELMEDLKSVGSKVNLFAFIALALLVVSVAVNVVLYLHILRVLP